MYASTDPDTSLLLTDVHVQAQELTEDILASQSQAVRVKFEQMFSQNVAGNAEEEETVVIAMVNANCKGYCRVLLD